MTTKNFDEQCMMRALALAKQAEQAGEIPVGAVFVDAHQNILAETYNQSITLSDPTAHAEILAIRQAGLLSQNYRLPGCTLYVTLEPCAMCFAALQHARIKRIVFGAIDNQPNRIKNHFMQKTSGILKIPCEQILLDFFKKKRKGL